MQRQGGSKTAAQASTEPADSATRTQAALTLKSAAKVPTRPSVSAAWSTSWNARPVKRSLYCRSVGAVPASATAALAADSALRQKMGAGGSAVTALPGTVAVDSSPLKALAASALAISIN